MRAAGKSLGILKLSWFLYLSVLISFTAGAGLGIFAANNLPSEHLADVHNYLNTFLNKIERLPIDSTQAARSILYENIILISILYFLGLTFAGIPFIFGVVLGRGFILGFAVSCLTKTMSWPGFILAVVSILPHNLLYLPALVIGAAAAISFALLTLKRPGDYRIRLWGCLMSYTAIMLGVMAVTLGAGLIEAYFSPWLTRLASGLIQMALSTN